MKLSIFTTITNPIARGDNYLDALNCYDELADELIVVNGGDEVGSLERDNLTYIHYQWPQEFYWTFIGRQFQRGYEAAGGDWVIHADIDCLFHEKDFAKIRKACERHSNEPALSFWKYQFILPDRYNLKSRLVLAVNKGVFGDRIRFNSGGDLCQPSLDGQYITPNEVPEARIAFYNYEKLLKTKEQLTNDCGRMDRAYWRHFKRWQLCQDDSGSDEAAFKGFMMLMQGRFAKPQEHIKLAEHPKYVQQTIANLKPQQFGYNGFELIKGGVYA